MKCRMQLNSEGAPVIIKKVLKVVCGDEWVVVTCKSGEQRFAKRAVEWYSVK